MCYGLLLQLLGDDAMRLQGCECGVYCPGCGAKFVLVSCVCKTGLERYIDVEQLAFGIGEIKKKKKLKLSTWEERKR